MNKNIEIGMIVRYAEKWCTPEERKYIHVVRENLLNPVTGKLTRWKIETLNSSLTWNPVSVVETEMIEPID